MDADWAFLSRALLWEEEDEFKNDSIGSDWTKEEDKALSYDYVAIGEAINSSDVPLPHYRIIDSDQGNKNKTLRSVRRGTPWTEEEHRRFLIGLEEFGRGDWRSIARFCVKTKTNTQVASHAQKYFQRMNSRSKNANSSKNDKQHSINDVTLDYPRTNSITMTGEKQLRLSPTDFIDLSTLFSNHKIGDGSSILGSTSAGKSIQDSAGTVTYHPSFPMVQNWGVYHPPAPFPLVEDSGIPNPFSSGVHEDNNMHDPGLFDFSFMNGIDSMMQHTGMNLGSSGVPFLPEVQPLVYGDRAPSYGFAPLEISSTLGSRQPLLQESGVLGSASRDIASSSTEMVDLDIFKLPHFLD